MAINTAQLADLLRPGLVKVYDSTPPVWWTDVFKPKFDETWYVSYMTARAAALYARDGGGPVEARKARDSQLTRLEQSQRDKRKMLERCRRPA